MPKLLVEPGAGTGGFGGGEGQARVDAAERKGSEGIDKRGRSVGQGRAADLEEGGTAGKEGVENVRFHWIGKV